MRMGFVIGVAVVLFGAAGCSRITDSVDDVDGALSITPPEFSDHPGFFPHGSRWFEYHRALSKATLFEIEQERLRIVYDASWVLNYTAKPVTGLNY